MAEPCVFVRRPRKSQSRGEVGLIPLPEIRTMVRASVQVECYFRNVARRTARGTLLDAGPIISGKRIGLTAIARYNARSDLGSVDFRWRLQKRIVQAEGQAQI